MSALTETPTEEMNEIYDRLQARFASRVTRSIGYRIYNLKQLGYMLKDNEKAIHAAVKEDLDIGGFGVSVADLWPPLNEIALAIKRLPKWAKDETRIMDSTLSFKFMNPRIRKEPKGVSLIISPWNFPWQLTLSPLVGAIAAGCPVVIKPSELSPNSSALMAKLIPRYLDPEAYAVVLGGPEQATRLLEKSWGHILYTGSGRVGKIVAAAAAKTLTPTTLELGGKSPVIVSKCADLRITARRLFTIKQLTCGQMCVSPDYVLCDRDRVKEFVAICKQTIDDFFPRRPHPQSMLVHDMTSRLKSKTAFDRLSGYVNEAEREGRLVYKGEKDEESLRMGFSVVLLSEDGVGEKGGLIDEEIFGPVLPIIPYSTLDAAIEYINSKPSPLALYVCSSKKSVFKKVVKETSSGSAAWGDFSFATYARSLPFGGVGESGYGSYHGEDGFRTFTHHKATIEIPLYFEALMQLRYPPLTDLRRRVLSLLLLSTTSYNRPTSVEYEERRLAWRMWRLPMAMLGVAMIVSVAAFMTPSIRDFVWRG